MFNEFNRLEGKSTDQRNENLQLRFPNPYEKF